MKWILIVTGIAFIVSAYLLLKAIIDGRKEYPEGTVIKYLDNCEDNEHSPEMIITDDLIKRVILRNKLDKMGKENSDFEKDVSLQNELEQKDITSKDVGEMKD